MHDLEKKLQENIDKWIGFNYTINEKFEQETVYGILRQVTDDVIRIEGILMHNINRKNCTILSILTRAKLEKQ